MSIVAGQATDSIRATSIRRDDLFRAWLPLGLILGLAFVVRHFVVANTDVSWEITLSEKILDGQRMYIDFIEVNPPASVFLYLPAVALARLFGWSPEFVVDAMVFVAALGSLGIVADIVRRYRLLDDLDGRAAAGFALAVLTILPAQTFAEREHIALIAVLPVLGTLVARAKGARPLLWHCLVAGAGAGVTVCIKPHFALAVGFAAAVAAWHARSWRTLLALENWIAGGIAVIYGVCVLIFYPAFIASVMPIVGDLYLPVRIPFVQILISTPMVLWVGAVLVVLGLCRHIGRSPEVLLPLMASAGFAVAYLVQGKGWPYQSYPMLALGLIALDLAGAVCRREAERMGKRDRGRNACTTLALVFIAVWSFAWLNVAVDTRSLTALVERVAPPHPSIVMVSDDIAVGHPLTREVRGRWLPRYMSLWIIQNASVLRAARDLDDSAARRISADVRAVRQELTREIRDGKPDVILVDDRPGRILVGNRLTSWNAWLNADPELSALLAGGYSNAGIADGVSVFKRNAR